jgi:hypothetical protein
MGFELNKDYRWYKEQKRDRDCEMEKAHRLKD